MNKKQPLLLILLLLIPSAALADGVSPILNFFHKDTWMPASIVTMVIILLESGLLRWRIRSIRFPGLLWRSALLNFASSLSGSILLIALSRDSFFMGDTLSLVVPLFVITLLTKVPLLHVLFRAVPLSWTRAALLGFGINLASYAAVFILEIGLFSGWLVYATHLDTRDLARWNNPGLLNQMSGLIFATESRGGTHTLRVYDPQTARWSTLGDCPSLDPNKWDVHGDTCAFLKWPPGDWKDRHLVVSRLPSFTNLFEISPATLADPQYDNWQGVTEVAVSPDQQKLAVLFRFTDAVAPKDGASYYDLGSKCRLIVISLASGREMARAPRWASDRGLCWLADSRHILFPSFADESLYQTTKAEVHGSTSYGYGRNPRFKRGLYVFDVETATSDYFANGCDPSLATAAGQILMRDDKGLLLLDSTGKHLERVNIPSRGPQSAVISPLGDMLLAKVRRRVPFYAGGRLVLLSKAKPDVRHVVDDGLCYRMEWTTKNNERPK